MMNTIAHCSRLSIDDKRIEFKILILCCGRTALSKLVSAASRRLHSVTTMTLVNCSFPVLRGRTVRGTPYQSASNPAINQKFASALVLVFLACEHKQSPSRLEVIFNYHCHPQHKEFTMAQQAQRQLHKNPLVATKNVYTAKLTSCCQ